MITCRYSPSARRFTNRLKHFSNQYTFHRARISGFPALKLPHWDPSYVMKSVTPLPQDRQLVIVGIGGATQGAKAVLSALREVHPHVFFDNFDPDFVCRTLRSIDLKRAFFVIISKSGETLETLSIAQLLIAKGAKAKQMLFISDVQAYDALARPLEKLARKIRAGRMYAPPEVPGRFSVFSEVGLVPLRLAGVDILALQKGARDASWSGAYRLAHHQALHYKTGKNICVLFSYASPLNETVNWYIQLLGESIGKSKRIGITPLSAHGTRDQHSLLQLFLDGPDDKFYLFIKEKELATSTRITPKGSSIENIFNAEYGGVIRAFENKKRPHVQLCLERITTHSIGTLLFLFELQIAFLGSILGVDIETQPAVEASKQYAIKILGHAREGHKSN